MQLIWCITYSIFVSLKFAGKDQTTIHVLKHRKSKMITKLLSCLSGATTGTIARSIYTNRPRMIINYLQSIIVQQLNITQEQINTKKIKYFKRVWRIVTNFVLNWKRFYLKKQQQIAKQFQRLLSLWLYVTRNCFPPCVWCTYS